PSPAGRQWRGGAGPGPARARSRGNSKRCPASPGTAVAAGRIAFRTWSAVPLVVWHSTRPYHPIRHGPGGKLNAAVRRITMTEEVRERSHPMSPTTCRRIALCVTLVLACGPAALGVRGQQPEFKTGYFNGKV